MQQNAIVSQTSSSSVVSKFIKLPDGNAVKPELIGGVLLIPNRGVICRDSSNGVIAYLKTEDDAIAARIREVLVHAIDKGNTDIDWSFLNKAESK